jgi:HlyD family secretion protein
VVPNAALRFRPASATDVAVREKPQPHAGAHAGTLYVLEARKLRAVPVQTGISDGRFTEIVAGELKAGDPVVVGAQEAAAETAPSTLRLRAF